MTLSVRMHVEFGEFEVVAQNRVDLALGTTRAPKPVQYLLMPPLVRAPAIPVSDPHQRQIFV